MCCNWIPGKKSPEKGPWKKKSLDINSSDTKISGHERHEGIL